MYPVTILGIGSALPDRVVTNAQLEEWTGFPASRMLELFEVRERHWSRGVDVPDPPQGQRCSDLAIAACSAAMRDAGATASDVGALIVVTTTPDTLNPPMDAVVAGSLGLTGIPAFTLQAPCTGMFRAVALASALLRELSGKSVLVVTSDTPSPFFRFGPERSTEHLLNSVLYADGAGALLLGSSGRENSRPTIELVDLLLNEETREPGITFPGMLSAMPPTPERFVSADYLGHHDFQRVLRHGSRLAIGAARRVMERLEVAPEDVQLFVTHQATGNLKKIGASYGLPAEKIPVNIERVGNTISASVLLLLDELAKSGGLAREDLLVLHTAESSTWSSAGLAVRW